MSATANSTRPNATSTATPSCANQSFVSTHGTKQLVDLLFQRGYFQSSGTNETNPMKDVQLQITLDNFVTYRGVQSAKTTTATSSNCNHDRMDTLILSSCSKNNNNDNNHCCLYSRTGLAEAIGMELEQNGGHLTIPMVASLLRVDEFQCTSLFQTIGDALSSSSFQTLPLSNSKSCITRHDKHLFLDSYWESIRQYIHLQLQLHGKLPIVQVSHQFDVPLDILSKQLPVLVSSGTSGNSSSCSNDNSTAVSLAAGLFHDEYSLLHEPGPDGGTRLVFCSNAYLEQFHAMVIGTFQALEEPTLVSKVCRDHGGWDIELVLQWLRSVSTGSVELDQENDTTGGRKFVTTTIAGSTLHEGIRNRLTASTSSTSSSSGSSSSTSISNFGKLQFDGTNIQTAMFLPQVYTEQKRKAIVEFVSANGYITSEISLHRYAILENEVIKIVKESFPNLILLHYRDTQQRDGTAACCSSSSSGGGSSHAGVLILASSSEECTGEQHPILQTLHAALQECQTSSSFVDLQEYLPIDLVCRPYLVQCLLDRIGFYTPGVERESSGKSTHSSSSSKPLAHSNGVAILTETHAMVVSNGMVDTISKQIMPSLIESFAKSRAEQLLEQELHNHDTSAEEASSSSRKGGKKSRKGKKGSKGNTSSSRAIMDTESSSSALASARDVVPLLQVAGAVLKQFPNFMPEESEQFLLDYADEITWDDSSNDGERGQKGRSELDDGLAANSGRALVEFCKVALDTQHFRSQCYQAIQAELHRFHSLRDSKASISRKDAATKVRTIEGAFQDAFNASCYMVQAMHKFLLLASSSDHFASTKGGDGTDQDFLEALEAEFLQGCCADLTSRVTQYCLFKYETDGGIFTFKCEDFSNDAGLGDNGNDGDTDDNQDPKTDVVGGLPSYCEPVNASIRQYEKTYLSCPPPREPLPVLRESLPGTLGVALARLWILCGGTCYQGGVRMVDEEDGSTATFTRPGDVEGFLKHMEENCLTLCGLPFKKLDKKAEKQFLFARRQNLAQALQNAIDPRTILDLTIMILFQQVRQVVVSGSLLRGPILKMLLEERKISEPVANILRSLAEQCSAEGTEVDDSLVATVRECGLCRDIAKFSI